MYIPIVINIVVSFSIGACIFHVYRGRVRRKKAKKEIAEQKEREDIFQCVEPLNETFEKYDSALYIESHVDLNHPDMGFNN